MHFTVNTFAEEKHLKLRVPDTILVDSFPYVFSSCSKHVVAHHAIQFIESVGQFLNAMFRLLFEKYYGNNF